MLSILLVFFSLPLDAVARCFLVVKSPLMCCKYEKVRISSNIRQSNKSNNKSSSRLLDRDDGGENETCNVPHIETGYAATLCTITDVTSSYTMKCTPRRPLRSLPSLDTESVGWGESGVVGVHPVGRRGVKTKRQKT